VEFIDVVVLDFSQTVPVGKIHIVAISYQTGSAQPVNPSECEIVEGYGNGLLRTSSSNLATMQTSSTKESLQSLPTQVGPVAHD
jgi:hypothetical protein